MLGYYGTDAQKHLQERVFESRRQIEETPGLCNAGRFLGIDDPDAVGWDTLGQLLAKDGAVGFRLIRLEQAAVLRPRLADAGFRLDTWDVFMARTAEIRPKIDGILASAPGGFVRNAALMEPEGVETRLVQDFLQHSGIAPFGGWMMVDGPRQATLTLSDREGGLAAVAHAYLPHNRHGPHARTAWVGMVAVAPFTRGSGLGRYVNALGIREAQDRLGAEHVYELVSSTNEPSRRMVAACGLKRDPSLVCGIALRAEAPKFTR